MQNHTSQTTKTNSSNRNPNTGLLRRGLRKLDALFNILYSSAWNPFYRTGTISILLLVIIIVTGLYLLFFYRLTAPYESVVEMSKEWWLGGWIRSLHRYASDFAVVFVFIHVVRMFAEKKHYGARTLAWISGVFCLFFLFGLGWTGFVLVWDRQGQELAVIGAQLLSLIPIFENVITRSFSGITPLGSSFFFMNLFLHVAVPLGMVIALWIHTSRLNQPRWVPEKKYSWYVVGFLILYSLLNPVDISSKANLFLIRETFYVDIYYNLMIIFHDFASSKYTLFFFILPFLLLIFVPYLFAPKKEEQNPKAQTDQKRCEGCQQCYEDCPFEAIKMVPRSEGSGSEIVAAVFDSKCVGCGICSASCSQLSIGPSAKSASIQLERTRQLKANTSIFDLVIVYCESEHTQESLALKLKETEYEKFKDISFYPIACLGELHIATLNVLSTQFTQVLVVSCPESICQNRSGVQLFKDRIFGQRGPKLPRMSDFKNVNHYEIAQSESLTLPHEKSSFTQKVVLIVASLTLMFLSTRLTNLPWSEPATHSGLRLTLRMPAQYLEECRELSKEEIEKRPLHMRKNKECSRTPIKYKIKLKLDGKDYWQSELSSPGLHSDKPYVIDQDFEITHGTHSIQLYIDSGHDLPQIPNYKYEFEANFAMSQRIIVFYNTTLRQIMHKIGE
jgi:ferredoxin